MKFKFKRNQISGIILYLKYLIFGFITKKNTKLFVRGSDCISTGPLMGVEHELFFSEFLRYCSKSNGDFLLDIGANIGLISCQVGDSFDQLDVVEPNPIVQNILKSNLLISFDKSKYKVHEFGLGAKDDRLVLKIPKHNFAGAFIKEGNPYDEKLLATKDGFKKIDESNYITTSVNIKNATDFFTDIFKLYVDNNKLNGVIKIDVEGFEMIVLEAIKKTLPSKLNLVICFENLNINFGLTDYLSNFDRDLEVYELSSGRFEDTASSIRNRINRLLFGWVYSLDPVDSNNLVGDLVIHIK